MAEEEYQIPIFFINGQLDSGKTRFITETIEMGQFAEAKNKLLIVCEEGEEEYDEKMLKDNGVSMVVLEKEDLTEEKLKELDKQYDPWIVIQRHVGPGTFNGNCKAVWLADLSVHYTGECRNLRCTVGKYEIHHG
jgi:putative membrane protein